MKDFIVSCINIITGFFLCYCFTYLMKKYKSSKRKKVVFDFKILTEHGVYYTNRYDIQEITVVDAKSHKIRKTRSYTVTFIDRQYHQTHISQEPFEIIQGKFEINVSKDILYLASRHPQDDSNKSFEVNIKTGKTIEEMSNT